MKDSSHKGKKGQRKAKRTETGESAATVKEQRKDHAQTVLEAALSSGESIIRSYEDIPRILRSYVKKYALCSDHFDVLDAADHCNLYIQIANSQKQLASPGHPPSGPPSLQTNIQHGQTTPVLSPAATECDVQSEGRAEQERDEDELVITPLEGDGGDSFNVTIYLSRTGPEVAKAYHCQNARSYISIGIIDRYRLTPDPDQSVRLTWEESDISRQSPKMKSTRFWIVENGEVRNDLAIGMECDQADELDDDYGRFELNHHEIMDEATESEDEEEDGEDSESEDAEDAESDDEEDESEDAEDEEQMSSDDSYVRVSPPNQMIVPPAHDTLRHIDRGSEVIGKVLFSLMDAVNNGQRNQPYVIPDTAKAGRSLPGQASSKQSANLHKVKGTRQRTRATRSEQPAPEPEYPPRKQSSKSIRIPKRRDSVIVSHVSDKNLPSLPVRRKANKKG